MTIPRHWPGLAGLRGLAILVVIPRNADRFAPVHDCTPWVAMASCVAAFASYRVLIEHPLGFERYFVP